MLPLFKAAMPYNKLIIYVVCCAGRTSTYSELIVQKIDRFNHPKFHPLPQGSFFNKCTQVTVLPEITKDTLYKKRFITTDMTAVPAGCAPDRILNICRYLVLRNRYFPTRVTKTDRSINTENLSRNHCKSFISAKCFTHR